MYELNDTILAVSSPTSNRRVILRLSGTGAVGLLEEFFNPAPLKPSRSITTGRIRINPGLEIEASVYLFPAPHSYTGEDVVEVHIYSSSSLTEVLMQNFIRSRTASVRLAGPGEFTARAYLYGKIDLSQAEAVNEIIVSSNTCQLRASEKLLSGRLARSTREIRTGIMECIAQLEAGLDFSDRDIKLISTSQMLQKLQHITDRLNKLITGSISFEQITDLPSAAVAGATNAGKSSLVNALLGTERSIVSEQHKTTRDVLAGTLELKHGSCIIFDCAGLVKTPANVLEKLSHQAAVEALKNSDITIFCLDVSKKSFLYDLNIYDFIESRPLIHLANKADLLDEPELRERLSTLNKLFSAAFYPASAKTGLGIRRLRALIDRKVLERRGLTESTDSAEVSSFHGTPALTARHTEAGYNALNDVYRAIQELDRKNDEISAMLLRAAYQQLSTITEHHIDERILSDIFGRFCVGK